MSRLDAAAVCTPGLEDVVAAELDGLGLRTRTGGAGVVPFRATTRELYLTNVLAATVTRVLVRIASFRATDFPHLERRAAEVDWDAHLADGVAPEFRVSSRRSALYHTDGIAQRLHRVVRPPSTGEPTQAFVVRFDRDVCTVSVDASGESLHRRAWRTEQGVAPLRPTHAAALLDVIGWDGSLPLADPFAGSGTIAIEAARRARGLAPGAGRSFAFERWPTFEPGTWASVQGHVASLERSTAVRIEAADRDDAAVAAVRANAERAGVADLIDVEQRPVSHLGGDDGTGWIVTNPPYGRRVGDGDVTDLHRRFGAVVRERRPAWGCALVANDARLVRIVDRRLRSGIRLGHGGLPVRFFSRPPRTSGGPTGPSAPADPGSAAPTS